MLDESNNTHIFLTRRYIVHLFLPFFLSILIEDSIRMIGITGDIRIIVDFVVESGGAGAIKEGISKNTSPESDLIQSKTL